MLPIGGAHDVSTRYSRLRTVSRDGVMRAAVITTAEPDEDRATRTRTLPCRWGFVCRCFAGMRLSAGPPYGAAVQHFEAVARNQSLRRSRCGRYQSCQYPHAARRHRCLAKTVTAAWLFLRRGSHLSPSRSARSPGGRCCSRLYCLLMSAIARSRP